MRYHSYFLLFLLFAGIVACHQGSENVAASAAGVNQTADFEKKDKAPAPPPPGNDGVAIERKLIKEGTLEYKVDNLRTARAQLLKAITKWNGYIGNESEYNVSDRNSTTIIIRVPAAHFDSLLAAATLGIAHFDRKDILVKDVTEEYVDVEARLNTKKDIEKRYLVLLNKANTVSEILEVEKELGVLRTDIESIEGRLNVLKNQVFYSTLTITMYEAVSAPTYFWDKIATGFVNGWDYLLSFIIGLVNLWPFLLIGAGAYWGIRRWKSARKIQRNVA